jgi:SAM-dependent methyltransferase
MAENAYQQVPYLTQPMAQTHPDRLASVATLFGMTPAPVTSCRVLEVGCGSGANLIPMAHFLPGSRFTGVDLAEGPIADGRRAVEELGLTNIELHAMDLCDIGGAMGQFDYIIAHGVYSWVPEPVREGLLAMCRERLAPSGVAFISFNALPGRHVRMMFRDMVQYHTRNCDDPMERIERARALLRIAGEAQLASGPWQPMIQQEVQSMLGGDPGWFFHDDLAGVNDSFHIRDFMARATSYGLQYLGDGEAHLMFDVRNVLDGVEGDLIEREQYFDFLCLRRFRQTMLCHSEVTLRRPPGPEQMEGYLFSSPARQGEGQIDGANGVSIPDPPPAIMRVGAMLAAAHPLPVAFERLLQAVPDRKSLRELLYALIASGFAEFHIHDFASQRQWSDRPRTSRLTAWEVARGNSVTYATHTSLKLDPIVHNLMRLMNGSRDYEALVTAFAQTDGAPDEEEIRAKLPGILRRMVATGLVE